MNRKHIDISKTHRINGKAFPWVHTIPAKSVNFTTANGISIAQIKRNYYLDTKKQKIRYQTMKTDNASYNVLVDVYAEIHPGIYVFMHIATENTISEVISDLIIHVNALSDKNIAAWFNALKRID